MQSWQAKEGPLRLPQVMELKLKSTIPTGWNLTKQQNKMKELRPGEMRSPRWVFQRVNLIVIFVCSRDILLKHLGAGKMQEANQLIAEWKLAGKTFKGVYWERVH